MIKEASDLFITNSIPCIILICMVVLLCVLSRTIKKGYAYIRITAYIVFLAQVIIQIMLGSTFEESVCIWICELLIALITAKKIEEEKVIEEEPKVEEESQEAPIQDTKEDNQ